MKLLQDLLKDSRARILWDTFFVWTGWWGIFHQTNRSLEIIGYFHWTGFEIFLQWWSWSIKSSRYIWLFFRCEAQENQYHIHLNWTRGLEKDGESTRCHCEIYDQVNGTNTCTPRAQMTAGRQPSQQNEWGFFAHPENWKAHRVLTSGVLIPSVMQVWCWTMIYNLSTELPEWLASELPLLPCRSGRAQSHPRLHGKGSLVS